MGACTTSKGETLEKLLTQAEVVARIAQATGTPRHTPTYRHIELLDTIARRAVDALRAPDGITLGLAEIDLRTRGFRPQDLVFFTGFSHSGKTQLVNTMIHNNRERRILFVSLDDPAEMIVTKLAAMHHGINAETLEQEIRRGATNVEDIFNSFAQTYPNLIITDKHLGIDSMNEAVAEATSVWGAPPHAVVVDYLELIPSDVDDGDGNGVKSKAKELQIWAKRCSWPTIVLHQGTRSNAKPGAPITLLSMAFGGEQQATIVIGVRRKRDIADLEPDERRWHQDSVTLHIVKNKRPGGKNTEFEGIDFYLDPNTGLIRTRQMTDRSGVADLVQESQRVASTQVSFDE